MTNIEPRQLVLFNTCIVCGRNTNHDDNALNSMFCSVMCENDFKEISELVHLQQEKERERLLYENSSINDYVDQ